MWRRGYSFCGSRVTTMRQTHRLTKRVFYRACSFVCNTHNRRFTTCINFGNSISSYLGVCTPLRFPSHIISHFQRGVFSMPRACCVPTKHNHLLPRLTCILFTFFLDGLLSFSFQFRPSRVEQKMWIATLASAVFEGLKVVVHAKECIDSWTQHQTRMQSLLREMIAQ